MKTLKSIFANILIGYLNTVYLRIKYKGLKLKYGLPLSEVVAIMDTLEDFEFQVFVSKLTDTKNDLSSRKIASKLKSLDDLLAPVFEATESHEDLTQKLENLKSEIISKRSFISGYHQEK